MAGPGDIINKERLLTHIRGTEEKVILLRVINKAEAVLRQFHPEAGDFLDPFHSQLAAGVLGGISGIRHRMDGGYPEAERKRVIISPDYEPIEEVDSQVAVLRIVGNFQFHSIGHRDFRGSLMSLGIRREKIGDLLVTPEGCDVVLDRAMSGYVYQNLQKVHLVTVAVKEISPSEIYRVEEIPDEINLSVASLRLDILASAAFGVPRSKMAGEIKAEKVKVNWQVIADPDHKLSEGDLISCRGRGRLVLDKVRGITKKGRQGVTIKRFQ
ncbi:MAG: YlmH family RNA-binding protein [Bacillota bacterium]